MEASIGIQAVCNSTLTGEAAVSKGLRDSIKVLGLAIHLSGDIYAHRTIVPRGLCKEYDNKNDNPFASSRAIIDEQKDEFVNYSEFRNLLSEMMSR